MSQDNTSANTADISGESSMPSRINELGELVFLVLNFCTTEPQFSNYARLAEEMGVPVAQAVAASIAGTILEHYEIRPKSSPAAVGTPIQ